MWQDGERLPIARVDDRGRNPGQTTLIGRGGVALDRVVSRDVDDLTLTHEFVGDLLDAESIPHEIDDPASNIRDNVGVLSAPSLTSLVDAFSDVDGVTGNTIPVRGDPDASSLDAQQTVWIGSARFEGDTDAFVDDLDPEPGTYWQDRAYRLESSGDSISWTFSSAWEWDATDLVAYIRGHTPTGEHPELTIRVDGTTVDIFPADNINAASDPEWNNFFPSGTQFDGITISGQTTVEIEATSNGSEAFLVDGGGLDSGFEDVSWNASIDNDGNISGPPIYPSTVELVTDDIGTIEQVVGASLDVDIDNTAGSQALAVSNDGGETWESVSNTDSLTTTFAEGSTQLRARVTLSRYDDGGENPPTGNAGQRLSSLSLGASLDDTPFIEAEAFEDSIAGLLTTLADRQGAAWELQSPDVHDCVEADGDDPGVVVWTQLGQRETEIDVSVLDWDTNEDASQIVDTVIAYGPSRRVQDERVTLEGTNLVGIGDAYLQPGTVRVYLPGADGEPDTVFDPDEDYRVLRNEGSIARREGSAIEDGETVHIDYETKRRSEYTLPSADGTGDTIRETFTNAVTQRALDQAALFAAKRLATPQREASVELERGDIGYRLVDALAVADVPGLDEPLPISDVNHSPESISISLGAAESARDVFDGIDRRLRGLSERL